MSSQQHPYNEIPFRGTGRAKDFHDVQDYEPGLIEQATECIHENPAVSMLSFFGIGLVIGAGVATAMSISRRQSVVTHGGSFDALSRKVTEAVSHALGRGDS